MSEYERLVSRCRVKKLNHRITNASISHAAVLFRNLFQAALDLPSDQPRRLVIQCASALESFYEEFIDLAKRVMDAGVTIHVLVSDPKVNGRNNSFLRAVLAHQNGDVRLMDDGSDTSLNFIIAGDRAYRVETDLEKVEAFANFNDTIIARILSQEFAVNWKSALPLEREPSPQNNLAEPALV